MSLCTSEKPTGWGATLHWQLVLGKSTLDTELEGFTVQIFSEIDICLGDKVAQPASFYAQLGKHEKLTSLSTLFPVLQRFEH